MPNHVSNEVVLHGMTLDKVRNKISGPNGVVDFNVLVPLPINYWAGSVGQEHEKYFPGTHLDEARRQWSTKWNAYHLGDDSLTEENGSVYIRFQTAWSTPRGWICALFNTFRCPITVTWFDEGGPAAIEEFLLDSGIFKEDEWKMTTFDVVTDEQKKLYERVVGYEYPEPEGDEDE